MFVLTGAYTGLRPGELAALRTDRLDLPRRQLRVEEPLKIPAARRTVTFSPFLAEELATHLDRYPGEKRFVFTAPEGGPPPSLSLCNAEIPCNTQGISRCGAEGI